MTASEFPNIVTVADAAQGRTLLLEADAAARAAIAKRLFVSTKTVDHHVSAILTKLGVPSREEAVAFARKKRPYREWGAPAVSPRPRCSPCSTG